MNFYLILGVSPEADDETIRSAYRELARRYHPDSGAGSSAAKFRQITEAYETLSDSARRRLYDRSLAEYTRAEYTRPAVPVEPMVAPAPLPRRVDYVRPPYWFEDFFNEWMELFGPWRG